MNTTVEIPSEPIIVSRRQENIDAAQKRATAGVLAINHFIQVYTSLGIGTLSLDDFSAIQRNGLEKFIRARVAGSEPVKVGGLTLSMDKVQAMVDIPDLTELRLALNQADSFIPLHHHGIMLNDGVAEVDQDWLNDVIDSNTQYLKTDEEKEAWLITQDIIQKMDYLYDRFGITLVSGQNTNLYQPPTRQQNSKTFTNLRYPGQYFDQLSKGAHRFQR